MQTFAFGTILGIVHQILGSHYILFLLYLFMNLMDLLAGGMAASSLGKFSNRELIKGLGRKLGYWIMIAVAFGMAFAFQGIGDSLGVDLSVTTLIGWITLSILFVNECRSILQHLVEMGVEVPKILMDTLRLAERSLESEDDYEGTMVVDTTNSDKDLYRLELNCDVSDLASKDVIRFKVDKSGSSLRANNADDSKTVDTNE